MALGSCLVCSNPTLVVCVCVGRIGIGIGISDPMRPQRTSIHAVTTWVRRQPPKVKAFLAVVSGMAALVLLRFIVHDHDNLFVAAEAVHSLGISVLIYKLIKEKTCAGSLTYPLPFSLSFFLSISYLSISFICLQFPYNKFGLLCSYPLIFNLM